MIISGYIDSKLWANRFANVQTSFCNGPRTIGTYTWIPRDPVVFGLPHITDSQLQNAPIFLMVGALAMILIVPMLVAGDETARTQRGNNNAWCQDNEISWLDWNLDEQRRDLLEFTRHLIQIFHSHPVLRRRKFFQGRQIRGAEIKDISWFRPDGREMTDDDWRNEQARSLAVQLAGDAIDEVDERGNRVTGDTLLLLLNAHHRVVSFVLPAHRQAVSWEPLLDTRESTGRRKTRRAVRGGGAYRVEARSLALFRLGTPAAQDERQRIEDEEAFAPTEESAQPSPGAPPTESVYCEHAGMIVPLDEGFCRACSRQVAEGDGIHRRPTPEMLKQLGYATTAEVLEAEAQEGEHATEDETEDGRQK